MKIDQDREVSIWVQINKIFQVWKKLFVEYLSLNLVTGGLYHEAGFAG